MAENLAHFYRDQRSMADATAKALRSYLLPHPSRSAEGCRESRKVQEKKKGCFGGLLSGRNFKSK